MKKNIGVIFDLDDTLYLERGFVLSGFKAVGDWCAAELGVSHIQKLAEELFDQGCRQRIFDKALGRSGIPARAEIVRKMVAVYRGHSPRISLLEDAAECLKQLKGSVYLGLLTDGYSSTQRAKIEALGLTSAFDAIVVTGDWGREFFKPHPRGYRHFEARAPECRGNFVYVADNPAKDFFAPRLLAWKAIRICRRAALYEHLPCPPDLIHSEIASLGALPAMLSRLFAMNV